MLRSISVIFLAIFVFGCAAGGITDKDAPGIDPRQVVGKPWQWMATITPVEQIAVPTPERYTVLLKEDGTAAIRFDCNRGMGGFEISEDRLSFGPLMSTKMACPKDSLDGRFSADLQRVSSFFLQNGMLYLELPYDSGTMRFRKAP